MTPALVQSLPLVRSESGPGAFLRREVIGDATLYLGDCREVLPLIGKVDAVVTDPPYPNGAGHFVESVEAAENFLKSFQCEHWLVFWTEMQKPPVQISHVATHIWYRTNTNRPDNYEPIYEFSKDPSKKASRVFPFCVIFPGLTGIKATGHPTEKNEQLMRVLVKRTSGLVLDPFMGSGTTGVAALQLGRKFIGIEREPKYFDIACERIRKESEQVKILDVFDAKPEKFETPSLL